MPNAPDSNGMTSAQRLDEVARILALGVLRLRARQKQEKSINSNHLMEFGLDFSPHQSMHGPKPAQGREGR